MPELSDFSAQRLGRPLRQGDYAEPGRGVDAALAKLRQTGATYAPAPRRSSGDRRYPITWDELRRHAAEGHEIANHSVTHPFMPALDEANIVYEIEKANQDIREQLGPKHTFSDRGALRYRRPARAPHRRLALCPHPQLGDR